MPLKYRLEVPSGKPDNVDLPLVIVLHGRGADANDLADLAPLLSRDCRFVFPNAPRVFEPYPGFGMGFTWFEGWPADRDSIAASRSLLLRFVDEMVSRYPTPPGKVILGGFSQGGLMSIDVGFRTSHKLAGIIVMSGAIYEQDLPSFEAKIPVLMIHGTDDEVIPLLVAHRTRRILEQHGIEPEYHEFPMGHQLTPESVAVVSEFIRQKLE